MFKTKNLTLILIGIMLFSLLLTVVGITLPISRKSDKIEEAGNQSMLSGDACAEGQRICDKRGCLHSLHSS